MNKKILGILALMFITALAVIGCNNENNQENEGGISNEKTEITIGKVPYPDMWPAAHIIGNIATELGYAVDYVEADMGLMYQGLSQGQITIFPDVCLPVVHQPYIDKYEGDFDIIGKYYTEAPSGFTVPSYMDIEHLDQLKDYVEEFGGNIVGIEPSAGMMLQAEQTIEEYGLDDYTLLEGSTPAMLAEVKKATANEEPILFLSWRPHPMWIDFEIKILKDSKDIWQTYDVMTGVNKNLKELAPEIYKFIEEFNVTLDDIEQLLVKIEVDGVDPDVVAKEWIEENRDFVDSVLEKI